MHEWANIHNPLPYAMLFKDVTARLQHQLPSSKVPLTQGQVQVAIADIFVGTLSCPRYFVDVHRRAAQLEACDAAGLGVQNPSEDMVAVAVFGVLEEVHGLRLPMLSGCAQLPTRHSIFAKGLPALWST